MNYSSYGHAGNAYGYAGSRNNTSQLRTHVH
jgi:hypothetical protein